MTASHCIFEFILETRAISTAAAHCRLRTARAATRHARCARRLRSPRNASRATASIFAARLAPQFGLMTDGHSPLIALRSESSPRVRPRIETSAPASRSARACSTTNVSESTGKRCAMISIRMNRPSSLNASGTGRRMRRSRIEQSLIRLQWTFPTCNSHAGPFQLPNSCWVRRFETTTRRCSKTSSQQRTSREKRFAATPFVTSSDKFHTL